MSKCYFVIRLETINSPFFFSHGWREASENLFSNSNIPNILSMYHCIFNVFRVNAKISSASLWSSKVCLTHDVRIMDGATDFKTSARIKIKPVGRHCEFARFQQ